MFETLIGNNQVKTALERLLESGRFPQSSIFAGQNGIGKKQFAFDIARRAVCVKSTESGPCQECSPCRRTTTFDFPKTDKKEDYERVFLSGHPDVGIVIPNRQTIYVDAIRNLEVESNFRPYEASSRFFIIDEAEKMNPQASNALLKTLEEPTETTYILLITSFPASLLPTIRSRCQTIRFSPIKQEEIARFLFEQRNCPSEDSKLLANVSRGSLGKALNIDPKVYREQRLIMLGVLESLTAQTQYLKLLRTSEEINRTKSKDEFEDYLSILQTLIHDIWKFKNDETSKIINFDLEAKLRKFDIPNNRLSAWLEEIETLRENLRYNLNRKIAADALFVKMAGG